MQFSTLSTFFEKIEKVVSRLEITRILADLYNQLTADEIAQTTYLLQGRVMPEYAGVEFGMGQKLVERGIAGALQIEVTSLRTEFKKQGDLGQVVEFYKKQILSFEEADLSITTVFNELLRLAHANGPGSQDTKVAIISHLIRQLDPLTCRYLVRMMLGQMRLGFSSMTVLDAYSWMLTGDKSMRAQIEEAYHVLPDLGRIGKILKEKGIVGLSDINPEIFIPIIMMRAERLSSGAEIIDKIGTCFIESKYDGFRLQIHYSGKTSEVRLYSRSLDDVSSMYPDVAQAVRENFGSHEVIFEGEAIGYDPITGGFLPFQETVQRKRKYDIDAVAERIPLRLFVFDMLYLDGKNYIKQPFSVRRTALEKLFEKISSIKTLQLAKQDRVESADVVDALFDSAITEGLEGIIAKKIDGLYRAGARDWNWIKFKRSYSSKIQDTIDVLVMGYDLGQGKRTGFGIGAFLVGVYDETLDQYVTVAKIGTGLTDNEWQELKRKSEKFKVKNKPTNYLVDPAMECDAWVVPSIVVEIRADEITRSQAHTAGRSMGLSKSGKSQVVMTAGFALRFPRLERFREDRTAEDVTTTGEIERMYNSQVSSQQK